MTAPGGTQPVQIGNARIAESPFPARLIRAGIAAVREPNEVEVDMLSHALGSRYADYMKRTKRLVPGVY